MKNGFQIKSIKQFLRANKTSQLWLLILGFILLWLIFITQTGILSNLSNGGTAKIQTFSGVYFTQPKPLIVLDQGYYSEELKPHALLVGSEDSSAAAIIAANENVTGEFNGKRMRLRGTLQYRDRKILIELTEGINSILSVEKNLTYPVQQTAPKPIRLEGNIIDAKCWFANNQEEETIDKHYIKQGISEGIPPLFKVEKDGQNIYYLLESTTTETINTAVIKFVADPVSISVEVLSQNGWNVLRTNAEQIIYLNEK